MTASLAVAVFDSGTGNLHSLVKVLVDGGADVRVEADPSRLVTADALVLPGVGAFGHAAARLAPARAALRSAMEGGLPTLGICLGMQLLFDASEEGAGQGIGRIPGRIEALQATRVPQIGWNTVDEACDALFRVAALDVAYYANGYVARPTAGNAVVAWSTHEEDRFPAAVRAGRTVGVQFHPEKSSRAGVAFVHAWLREAASCS